MKLTPALPNPYPPPAPQGRSTVGAVRAGQAPRDAADGRDPRRLPQSRPDVPPSTGRSEVLATRQGGHGAHAARALASYAAVANDGEHSALRELLGFDAYA